MRLAFLALFLSMFAAVGLAQDTRATLLGRVTDSSGAVVAGATVRARNVQTNAVTTAQSNAEGNYAVPYLLPGTYKLTVEQTGFKSWVRDGIELRTSERRTFDAQLDIGATTETVEVKAEAPMLDQSTATLGSTIDGSRLSELPQIGGNPNYLARLVPGFMSTGGRTAGNPFDYGAGSTDSAVNGTRGGSNEVQLDGSE